MKTNNHNRVNENCEKIANDPEAMAHYITCLEDAIYNLQHDKPKTHSQSMVSNDLLISDTYTEILNAGYSPFK